MLLSNLIKISNKDQDCEVKFLTKDCDKANEGVYFCLSDDEEVAIRRAQEAYDNDATMIVSRFDLPFDNCVQIDDVRGCFANACKLFYGSACDRMKIVGITGTNGKTTTSHIVGEILKRNGINVGVIGTNGVFYNGKRFDCPLTTPDADFLHKTFADMEKCGVEYVVMEVSAHAIVQKRVDAISFECAVLTNITQDHLDYFKNMESYEKAKISFLTARHAKKAVICADDQRCLNHLQNIKIPYVTYGIKNPADCFALDPICDINGSHFVANILDDVFEIKTNLVGEYNVCNALAAMAVCKLLGLSNRQISRGINFVKPVEGRFNIINVGGAYVVIDFAHTPDGVEKLLQTARSLTNKNVYIVFGCGGNRDSSKRHLMGEIAEKYADYVMLTNDNPRDEDPQKIISDIEKNMQKPHFVELNREDAIKKMVSFLRQGDILLVAGKGAEKYQEINGEKIPYNDFDVVKKCSQKIEGVTKNDC